MTKNDATPATMGLPTELLVAGDFDDDTHGHGYAQLRRTDSRIAALVHEALGAARTVLNVGAGAGSYEPEDRYVLALEPSAAMRAQRPPRPTPLQHQRSLIAFERIGDRLLQAHRLPRRPRRREGRRVELRPCSRQLTFI